MYIKTIASAFLLMFISCLGLVSRVQAQEYPTKTIRLVIPYPPGGSTDVMARLIAQRLAPIVKQAVVVENKAGASGIIGSEFVAKSKPDGYTIFLTGSGPHAINISLFPKLPYDPLKDFVSIGLPAVFPLLMSAPASAPYADVAGFIAFAKREQGKVNYCSIGAGTPSHLAAEMFATAAGIKMTHLPYKGSGPALVDTMAGVCNVIFDSALSSGPHVRSGKLKALGIASTTRLQAWSNVPTIAESGLPGFEAATWLAMLAPAGTPAAVVARLNKELNQILAMPEVRETIDHPRWEHQA
ncbi:MAG: tripartite tricarboxylate transporter substrate binding protein [Betaproteobacteria bacterium]|nr:tripartite tricarboxylate transporter substrate binding protein [Betaproteobacteria bacterium]